ncbi:hypothetical protein PENTCL1PPCAC_21871, partial [Pristionchus entomophagus]
RSFEWSREKAGRRKFDLVRAGPVSIPAFQFHQDAAFHCRIHREGSHHHSCTEWVFPPRPFHSLERLCE